MATLKLSVEASSARRRRHPKAALVGEHGAVLELPFAPTRISHGGFAGRYVPVDRIALKPILDRAGPELRTLDYELLFAHPNDHQRAVTHLTELLERFAETGQRVRFRGMATAERGWFQITALSYDDELRQEGTNAITRARAQVTLTEASEARIPIRGHASKQKWPRTYTTKKGDTLRSIARKFYGHASKWPLIAKANHIRHPHRALAAGRRLTIPRPD